MKILDLQDGKVIVSPEALNVPEFKAIWLRDLQKSKARALAELSYVYYLVNPNSPYANYSADKKRVILGEDMFSDPKYKPDDRVQEAIKKYESMIITSLTRLLNAVTNKIDELTEFLNNTPVTADTLKDILTIIGKAAVLVTEVTAIKSAVEKEQKTRGKVRGQIEVGDYER